MSERKLPDNGTIGHSEIMAEFERVGKFDLSADGAPLIDKVASTPISESDFYGAVNAPPETPGGSFTTSEEWANGLEAETIPDTGNYGFAIPYADDTQLAIRGPTFTSSVNIGGPRVSFGHLDFSPDPYPSTGNIKMLYKLTVVWYSDKGYNNSKGTVNLMYGMKFDPGRFDDPTRKIFHSRNQPRWPGKYGWDFLARPLVKIGNWASGQAGWVGLGGPEDQPGTWVARDGAKQQTFNTEGREVFLASKLTSGTSIGIYGSASSYASEYVREFGVKNYDFQFYHVQ